MIPLKNIYRATSCNHLAWSYNVLRRYCGANDDNNTQNKKDAKEKLNQLLKKMLDEKVEKSTTKLDFAKAKNHKAAKTTPKKEESKELSNLEIMKAVKNVAEELGENKKETESELLNKLLNPSANDMQKPAQSLSDIVRGMKIDRESKKPEVSRAQQVKMLLEKGKYQKQEPLEQIQSRRRKIRQEKPLKPIEIVRIDLFGAEPLGIFRTDCPKPEENINKTWKILHERELRLAITHPPSNYFQEMILWTEQGKLWKFPIDNEQDLGEENSVYFTEHVFLDKYLEPWCPTKGPIRHFMELVCVGLSKNPYLSVKEKREHIEWYRDYFNEKKKLLTEVGALPAGHEMVKEIKDT